MCVFTQGRLIHNYFLIYFNTSQDLREAPPKDFGIRINILNSLPSFL